MIAIPIDMPKGCYHCPCNDSDYKCNLTDIVFVDRAIHPFCERLPECPLIDLTQYDDDGK